jgi:hypothetical protein
LRGLEIAQREVDLNVLRLRIEDNDAIVEGRGALTATG